MIQKKLISEQDSLTEQEAMSFLERKGYLIVKSDKNSGNTSNQEIVDYFYIQMKELVGSDRACFLQIKNSTELEAIQRFQSKAKRLAIGKKEANAYILNTLKLYFKYINELSLNNIPDSITFLLSKDGSWIFSNVLKLHKKKIQEYENSEEASNYKEMLYNTEDDILEKLREERYKKILNS